MGWTKTKYKKSDIDPNAKYYVSYKSKYGNCIDTTFHTNSAALGRDVAWLVANGYCITSVKSLKKNVKNKGVK